MSDEDRLRDISAQLTVDPKASPDGARAVVLTDMADGLRAILAEISETVLTRDVVVSIDGADAVMLRLAGRRIYDVTGAKAGVLNGTALSEENTEQAGDLATLFQDLLYNATEVSFLAVRSETPVDPTAIGWSADALAQAWGVDLFQARATLSPADFVQACKDTAVASLLVEADAEPLVEGAAELVQILRDQIGRPNVPSANLSRCFRAKTDANLIVLGTGAGDNLSIVLARSDNSQGALLVPADQIGTVYEAWHGR